MELSKTMENGIEVDIDYNLDDPHAKSGVYGLWLHVFYISVIEYLHSARFSQVAAEGFLFDSENIFFDYVADCMGYEPQALREAIKKSYKKRHGVKITLPWGDKDLNQIVQWRAFKRVISFSIWFW